MERKKRRGEITHTFNEGVSGAATESQVREPSDPSDHQYWLPFSPRKKPTTLDQNKIHHLESSFHSSGHDGVQAGRLDYPRPLKMNGSERANGG